MRPSRKGPGKGVARQEKAQAQAPRKLKLEENCKAGVPVSEDESTSLTPLLKIVEAGVGLKKLIPETL